MTKIAFDPEINSKLFAKIDNTTASLDKLISIANRTNIPRTFNASYYRDNISKLKKLSTNLKNLESDLKNASRAYEQAIINCKRKNTNFNSSFKLDADDPVIEIR